VIFFSPEKLTAAFQRRGNEQEEKTKVRAKHL